jgi:hypothetical protein
MNLPILFLAASALLMHSAANGADSFTPGELWKDTDGVHINAHGGGVIHHEGTYYWFGEHKISGPEGNSAQVGVGCYSSTDLLTWRNEGIAMPVSEEAGSEIARGCIIERPKVLRNPATGKFVMWFHLEHRGRGYATARAAVAVADKITGPYVFHASYRPNAGSLPVNYDPEAKDPVFEYFKRDLPGGQMSRDMTVFADDDGKAYLIGAAEENYTLDVSLLTPDYLGFTGVYSRVEPGGHNEAPAICKQDGKYWMITSGCTGWDPNAARSFVANHPLGPWKSLGNPCVGPNPDGGPGPELTYGGQSTWILPFAGKPGAFIAMFDVWRPKDPVDGRYLWMPLDFRHGRVLVMPPAKWDLSVFDRSARP